MFDNSAVKLPNIIRDDTKRRSTLMDTVKLTNIDVASEEKFIYEQKVLKNLKKDIFNFYTNNLNADKENRQFLGLIDKNYGIVDKNNTHQVNNSPVVLPNIETQAYKSRQLRHSHSEYKITKVNPKVATARPQTSPNRRMHTIVAMADAPMLTKLLPINIRPIRRSGRCSNFCTRIAPLCPSFSKCFRRYRLIDIMPVSELEKNAESKMRIPRRINKLLVDMSSN